MKSTQKQHLVIKIQSTKLNIIDELMKKRCEIQNSEDFQPCRKFIAEELAFHLIIDIKTVKGGEPKIKLGFNQLDPTMINRFKDKKSIPKRTNN